MTRPFLNFQSNQLKALTSRLTSCLLISPSTFQKIIFFIGLTGAALNAANDYDLEDYGSLEITNQKPQDRARPFSFNVFGDAIGSSKIERGYYEGDHVSFAEIDAEAGMVVYYCKPIEEALQVSLRYSHTYINWENNPWFSQTRFDNGEINFSGLSKRFCHWLLRGQVSVEINLQELETDYIKYDFIFWGRYTYNSCVGLNIGAIAYTGIDLNWACPIIGFDWQISKKWKLNVIYPVNISLEYFLNKEWTISLANRNFDNRQRVKKHEGLPKAVIRYRNCGAELMAKYSSGWITSNIHGGVTFDGRYRIANRHNKHGHTYHLGSAAYVGAEVDLQF